MSKQKPDWAEQTALWLIGYRNERQRVKAIAAALRRAKKQGWQARQKYDEAVRMGRVKP